MRPFDFREWFVCRACVSERFPRGRRGEKQRVGNSDLGMAARKLCLGVSVHRKLPAFGVIKNVTSSCEQTIENLSATNVGFTSTADVSTTD